MDKVTVRIEVVSLPHSGASQYFGRAVFATRVTTFLLILCALLITGQSLASESASFVQVETETLDKEDFLFPDDLSASTLNIVLIAISKEQENGEMQGDELLEWYAALDNRGALSDEVRAYHFSVMKVPFFVKGLIRGGLADSYTGKVPLDQAGALFIKDIDGFAEAAEIPLDGQSTVVLVDADGNLLESFKGKATEENVSAVVAAIATYLPAESAE